MATGIRTAEKTAGRTWRLQLADGQRWDLSADASLSSWLGQFAHILNLEMNGHDLGASLIFKTGGKVENSPGHLLDLGPLRLRKFDDSPDVICEFKGRRGSRRDIECMWHALTPIYRDAIRRQGLPLHAGLIEINGRGVLLAGSSGRGKSTLCRRLPSSYTVLCDEETLVVRDGQGRYWGHPFPTWSRLMKRGHEESWTVQEAVPLSHILFITPAEKDEIKTLGGGRAAMLTTRSALEKSLRSWGRGDADDREGRAIKNQIFHNACLLAGTIPSSLFHVSLTGRIDQEMQKVLRC